MREPPIDPPCEEEDIKWVDDLYEEYESEEDEATALHFYECQVYNELDRRYRTC